MRVFVTGATGFFGSEIATRLSSAGHCVIGGSRSGGKRGANLSLDVTTLDSCTRALDLAAPVDAVVHAAALAHARIDDRSARRCYAINVGGTENMVEAAASAGVNRFALISSVVVYGGFDLPEVVVESTHCRPQGPYAQSKLRAEQIVRKWNGPMSVQILRMAPMYSEKWLSNVRKRVRPFGGSPSLEFTFNPSLRRYSFCSRGNAAEAVLWAVEGRMPPDVYNVADQYEYCQWEILEAVAREDGAGWRVPVPAAITRALWHATRLGVPISGWRNSAHAQYWKFCERNVYSVEKLGGLGLKTPPDLLTQETSNSPVCSGDLLL